MDKIILERDVQLHRAFSDSFIFHFERLNSKPCTKEERNIIESSTLCCSLMHLEVLELGLINAKTAYEAQEIYKFLHEEVNKYCKSVITYFNNIIQEHSLDFEISNIENLLETEQKLLGKL